MKPLKTKLFNERRTVLKEKGYTNDYIKLCKDYSQKEEDYMAEVTDVILDQIKMQHDFFQNSLVRKSVDVTFMGEI